MLFVASILPFHWIVKITFIMMGGLILFYALTLRKCGFGRTDDDARVWLRWTMVLMMGTGLFALWMDRPNTNSEFELLLIVIATYSFSLLYPMLMERLNKSRSKKSEV